MVKMKAVYERSGVNYVTYDNPDSANVINERFYLEKRLFGVMIFRKTWKQDSSIMDRRSAKQTGFKI